MPFPLCGLFNSQDILIEQLWYYQNDNRFRGGGNRGLIPFSKRISLNVNVIALPEFELTMF